MLATLAGRITFNGNIHKSWFLCLPSFVHKLLHKPIYIYCHNTGISRLVKERAVIGCSLESCKCRVILQRLHYVIDGTRYVCCLWLVVARLCATDYKCAFRYWMMISSRLFTSGMRACKSPQSLPNMTKRHKQHLFLMPNHLSFRWCRARAERGDYSYSDDVFHRIYIYIYNFTFIFYFM